jgi:hypothetical protein
MNKAGSLPSAGVVLSLRLDRYYEPLRLPVRADALSSPYTHRSVASPPPEMGLQHWATNPREHADPAIPGTVDATSVIPASIQRPSPSDHRVDVSNFVYNATHGFTCVTACSLAVWKLTTPRYRGAASSCYRAYGQLPGRDFNPLDLRLLLRTVWLAFSTAAPALVSSGGDNCATQFCPRGQDEDYGDRCRPKLILEIKCIVNNVLLYNFNILL